MEILKFDPEHGTDGPRERAEIMRKRNERLAKGAWDRLARRIERDERRRHRLLMIWAWGSLALGVLAVVALVWFLIQVEVL